MQDQIDALNNIDAAAVLKAVDDPRWHARPLAAALSKHGVSIDFSSINRHRAGTCPCRRKGEK